MSAAAVRIDRLLEWDVGGVVAADQPAGMLGGHGERRPFGLGFLEPAVVHRLGAVPFESAGGIGERTLSTPHRAAAQRGRHAEYCTNKQPLCKEVRVQEDRLHRWRRKCGHEQCAHRSCANRGPLLRRDRGAPARPPSVRRRSVRACPATAARDARPHGGRIAPSWCALRRPPRHNGARPWPPGVCVFTDSGSYGHSPHGTKAAKSAVARLTGAREIPCATARYARDCPYRRART